MAVTQKPARNGAECRPMRRPPGSSIGLNPTTSATKPKNTLISGTSTTPRQSAVQNRSGARAKPRTKGAVEPMKLRAMSPNPATRPMGRTTRLTAAMATKTMKGQLTTLLMP